ncbi:LysR family transcriptional regulator [Pseudoalteromonas rhizosphaerae]|uniref:LysR family transcriptional regulator n=1 Tax=Pseudoalteromonas rhizosphaerae TaxID=2518973 RepID=UPI002147F272|nr:LysR family transcriptional regulator [Pseudoalteromonas rhizosphaerae]
MNTKLLRTLTVFVRIVETGSMSKAAVDLAMTTSAISQQIKQIELDIKLSLFNRSPRELTLTEAGEIYYQSCVTILTAAKQAGEKLQFLQNSPSGQLKLVAPVGFGGGILSEPLKKLTNQYPDFDVQLTLSDEPLDIIKSGADLAIAIGPLDDSSLVARPLAKWPLVLCVHKSHPLAEHCTLSPWQLNHHTRISHCTADHPLTHSLNSQKKALPKPRIVVNNMHSIIQLVCDGVGYAILPKPEVQSLLLKGELVELCTDWQLPTYSVYAITPARDILAGKTKVAIEILKQHCDEISDSLNQSA